jgi:hypothetical protein
VSLQQEEALPALASKGDKDGANIQRQLFLNLFLSFPNAVEHNS